MKEFFASLKFKILVCVCAVLAGFILYAITNENASNFVEAGLDFIVTPIRSASAHVSESVGEFFKKYVQINEVYAENEELREQIAQLKQEIVDLNSYKLENDQLKEYLQIKTLNPEFELETASVIGNDPLDSFSAFTIDKGSIHGVESGDVVISTDGLVGVISQVNAISSRVSTILDPSVQVGAVISETGDVGIIKNTVANAKSQCTLLTMISRDTQTKAGDFVVTSGNGGVFPKGIIIGTIESTELDSNGLSINAVVKTGADIRNIKNVVIIKSFLGQGETSSQGGGE